MRQLEFTIQMMVYPMNPPKPAGFDVRDAEGKWIASLSIEQIRKALADYERVMAARSASPPLPSG